MNKFEKYSSYKDSGVEWLGEIPEHWKSISIKRLITLLTDYTANGSFADLAKNVQYLDEPSYAQLIRLTDIRKGLKEKGIYITEKSYKYLNKSSLFGGELLMANVGAYSGYSFLLPEKLDFKASLAPNMFLIKFNNKQIDNKFIFYVLNCDTILSRLVLIATSTAQPKLNKDNVRSISLPLPPQPEQTKIASFLDDKTAQIDEVISQKEKLIELLKERKQIVINDAVTKGLDKDVEFVDSDVEWIGKIPKHWKLERLGSNFIERREKVSDKDFEPLSVTKNGVVPQLDSAAKSNDGDNRKLVRKGDFVINSRSDRKGSSGLSKLDGSVSLINIVLQPININSNFSHILLKSNGFIEEFYRNGHGIVADLWTTRFWDMKSIMLAIPPKDEQIKIVEYIENQTSKIDIAIELQQNYISKLKEYKASLIDSVVTGKVKVS